MWRMSSYPNYIFTTRQERNIHNPVQPNSVQYSQLQPSRAQYSPLQPNTAHCSPAQPSQVPRPTFGSGSGLQCVYTVVISLWGNPAPTFLLEPPKTLFYWIAPYIRKPQAEFRKFSSTHVSPSDWFISSSWSPLSSSSHLPLLMCVFLRTRPFRFPISFQHYLKGASKSDPRH